MGYSPLPTVVTGDSWTAANANTYWRDNFAAGVPDIFEAAGDLAYGSNINAAAKLVLGSARQRLTVSDAGLPAWKYPQIIGCDLWREAVMSIPDNTYTKVEFDTEKFDTVSMWSSTDSDAIIIPYTGVWQVNVWVNFSGDTSTNSIAVKGQIIMNTRLSWWVSASLVKKYTAAEEIYVSLLKIVGSTSNIQKVHCQVLFLGAE